MFKGDIDQTFFYNEELQIIIAAGRENKISFFKHVENNLDGEWQSDFESRVTCDKEIGLRDM